MNAPEASAGEAAVIRAAVCREFGKPLSVEQLRLSQPQPGQARVRLSACAICHSDITYMDGGWGGTPPIVFGHEAAGVVEETGAGCAFQPGDRVIATLLRSCGRCLACEDGAPSQCKGEFPDAPHLHTLKGESVAAGLKTAAFAEQIVVDASQMAPIPDDLPFDEASLLACGVLTGWGAVANTARLAPGQSAAVIGCGGVGLNCLQAAIAAGAYPVVAIDSAHEKLDIARQFGATHQFQAGDEGEARAREANGGRGFDFVFMAAGSNRAVESAIRLVAPMGAAVLAGMPPDGDFAKLDATAIAHGHRRILGSKMGGARLRVDIPRLLAMRDAGKLKLRELIGRRFSLDEINDAIADARGGGALRNVIIFD